MTRHEQEAPVVPLPFLLLFLEVATPALHESDDPTIAETETDSGKDGIVKKDYADDEDESSEPTNTLLLADFGQQRGCRLLMLVLFLSHDLDGHLAPVAQILRAHGWEVLRVNLADVPFKVSLSSALTWHGWEGTLTYQGQTIELAHIKAVWWRRPTSAVPPATYTPAQGAFWLRENERGFTSILLPPPGALFPFLGVSSRCHSPCGAQTIPTGGSTGAWPGCAPNASDQ